MKRSLALLFHPIWHFLICCCSDFFFLLVLFNAYETLSDLPRATQEPHCPPIPIEGEIIWVNTPTWHSTDWKSCIELHHPTLTLQGPVSVNSLPTAIHKWTLQTRMPRSVIKLFSLAFLPRWDVIKHLPSWITLSDKKVRWKALSKQGLQGLKNMWLYLPIQCVDFRDCIVKTDFILPKYLRIYLVSST